MVAESNWRGSLTVNQVARGFDSPRSPYEQMRSREILLVRIQRRTPKDVRLGLVLSASGSLLYLGGIAEWLGGGLQNLQRRFDSCCRLFELHALPYLLSETPSCSPYNKEGEN